MLPWIALALSAVLLAVLGWLALYRPDPRHAFMFNLVGALASSTDPEWERMPEEETKQRAAS